MDGVRLEGTSGLSGCGSVMGSRRLLVNGVATYHKGIQDANSDPKASPHRVYDRHQGISSPEAIDPGNELRQSAKDPNEREKDRWR